MDWTWYLFRLDGRINRAKYWLAALIIACGMAFLAGLVVSVSKLFGGSPWFGFDTDDLFGIVGPSAYRWLSWTEIPSSFARLIGTALFLWIYFATSIKRLHDRDKSGWWMVPFFLLPGLYNQFSDRLDDSYLMVTFG